MVLGFTGTRKGMTDAQRKTVRELLPILLHKADIVVHGGCVGADTDFHQIAQELGIWTVVRPSNIEEMVGVKTGNLTYDPEDPMVRNKKIAEYCRVLLATPSSNEEINRSGTWATIRMAREFGKGVIIVFPDGTYKQEKSVKKERTEKIGRGLYKQFSIKEKGDD